MKLISTLGQIVFIAFIISCSNQNKNNNNLSQAVDTTKRQDTAIKKTSSKEERFLGIYKRHLDANKIQDEYTKLELTINNKFKMTANLCEGTGTITGDFKLDNNKLLFRNTKKDFKGFRGDEQTDFDMTINADSDLIYNGVDIGCGPDPNDVFKKDRE